MGYTPFPQLLQSCGKHPCLSAKKIIGGNHMKNRKHTRGLSLLLCAALLAGQLGTTVYAEGASPEYRGVCEHHPEHTEACGYMEAEPGQPCQHQHTKDCYTNELICGFDDEDTPTATDSDASAVHEHTQECYALDCPHERGEHDDTCGYVEDVPGSLCTHSCELCDPQDKENVGGADREDGLDHSAPALGTSEENDQTTVANDGLMPPVATVSNVTSVEGNGYSFESGTLTITTNEGTTAWQYDDSINGTDITKVVVGNDVTEIRDWAFMDCSNLTQAELPSSLKSIGYKAFMNCGKLDLTELPSGVTSIGEDAFRGCGKLDLTELPSSVTSIGNAAFYNCENLALKELPSGVTFIEDYAFRGCGKLALDKLPNKVTSIGYAAFANCGKLALTELPSGVTSIGNAAFSGCKNLALEELPSGVTSIGIRAFSYCENLALRSLPRDLTSIGDYAFDGCTGLTSLTIPISNAPNLGDGAFVHISNLTIFVPAGATGYNTGGWVDYADKLVFGAALERLTISDGDLNPDFFAGRESYAVSVPNSTTSVKVTPTAHGTGTITVNDIGIDSGDTSGEITLEAGKANEIKIVVENSSTDSRTYTVTVTRAADPACSIEVNKESLDFGTVNVGYKVGNDAGPRRQSVVVTNTCSQVVTLTPLTLPPSSAYELAELSKLKLEPGKSADFIIGPQNDLPMGTYKEQLTISGTGGAKATVDLKFIVTEKPTYTVLIHGGTSSGDIFQEGEPVTITATVPSGQQFTGWTITPDNVTFTQGGKDTETATFTMPN
ncbi:leucine-rich repeat protein, partial [Hungatella hathewayi]